MTKLINNCSHHTITVDGVVTNTKTNRIKSTWIGANGYLYVDILENGSSMKKAIHRLLAETFIDNPENKRTVNHIDGNKLNNSLSNIEWATDAENIQHAYDNSLQPYRRNYTFEDYENFFRQFMQGQTLTSIALTINQSLTQLSLHVREAAIRLNKLDEYQTELKRQRSISQLNSNRNTTKVKMIDMTTKQVLQTFDKIKDAMRFLNKSTSGPISNVLNGKQKSAYGYFWERG